MKNSAGRLVDANNRYVKTHGKSRLTIYNIWLGIVARCTNPSHARYQDYGGRGIKVCKRWLKFENFYTDMGDRPSEMSIDRVDNDKGYSKSNCRWATRAEQAANTRRNLKKIEVDSQLFTVKEASKKFGIEYRLLWWRLNSGWSVDLACKTPSKRGRNNRNQLTRKSTLSNPKNTAR